MIDQVVYVMIHVHVYISKPPCLTDGLAQLSGDVRNQQVAPMKFSDHYLGQLKDFRVGAWNHSLFSRIPLGAFVKFCRLIASHEVDIDLVVPDDSKTYVRGLIVPSQELLS